VLLVVIGWQASGPLRARLDVDALGAAAPSSASTDGSPPVAGLDPELQRRFDAAQAAAAAEGVALTITSGWRSVAEQQAIIDQTVDQYGTAQEAHRWVLPPEQSAHVQGLAIDVGPTAGALWLGEHGTEYGLCRTYANEAWHFEPLPDGNTTCPEPHPDSSWGW
jgi:LAS superfamily LD-carboxypeptidase LdcB